MPSLPLRRPRLARHYYVLSQPPDQQGDEALCFVSDARRVKIKGHSFREFQAAVLPLLDGMHTVDEIARSTASVFAAEDLDAALAVLLEHELLEEGDDSAGWSELPDRLAPQLNLFQAFGGDAPAAQRRLRDAQVSVMGLGGAGAAAALRLGAAGVGRLRLLDPNPVAAHDVLLSTGYAAADVGAPRADVLRARLTASAPEVRTTLFADPLGDDAAVAAAVTGSDFVVCALDAAEASLTYKLNRVCLEHRLPWVVARAEAMEVLVGPLMRAFETACYLCYSMRLVACANEPEAEFAFQSFLDRQKRDDSGMRPTLACGPALAGELAALEAIKSLSGVVAPATVGRLVVVDLLGLTSTVHQVLRKPWCPACASTPTDPAAGPR